MDTDTQKEETNKTTEETPLIERLFSTGAHFGFTKSRRHPTATKYIYGNKQGVDIIDLEATIYLLEKAKVFIKDAGKSGKTILFVGTKEETAKIVLEHAEIIGAPVVANRWVGGVLTNFAEIKKRIQRLIDLTKEGESGELERKYTKKERVLLGRELGKLTNNFSGIKEMTRLPHALIVVDPRHNSIAVAEANKLNIPVIGITNSDTNMKLLTYPIIVNDGIRASVSLILDELVDAYKSGKEEYEEPQSNNQGSTSKK